MESLPMGGEPRDMLNEAFWVENMQVEQWKTKISNEQKTWVSGF